MSGSRESELKELAEIVASDLDHFRSTWAPDTDDHGLRRDSAVLRRLLIDGEIQRLWRLTGREGQPQVEGKDLNDLPRNSDLMFATADRVDLHGMTIYETRAYSAIQSDDTVVLTTRALPLSRYLDGACIVVDGECVRRRDVIQYIANKRGGAHYDRIRSPIKKRSYFALDKLSSEYEIGQRNAAFAQLLAIGQAIVRSEDIQRLVDFP